MRFEKVLLVAVFLSGWDFVHAETGPESEEANRAKPEVKKSLTEFEDANFGVHFSHSDVFSTEYNPHGGADRVLIVSNGKALGGLKIGRKPPPMSVKDFVAAGIDHYKETYNTSSVAYSIYKTKDSYEFHYLKADVELNKERYVVERFVYLRDALGASVESPQAPTAKPSKESSDAASIAETLMAEISGSFSFEFLLPAADYERLKPEIRTVIDTFRIVNKPATEKQGNR